MNFLELIWLIPLFPVFGALCMLLFGKKLPQKVVSLLCPGTVLVSFIFSVGSVVQLAGLPERSRPPTETAGLRRLARRR